jgi:hypothetical protein
MTRKTIVITKRSESELRDAMNSALRNPYLPNGRVVTIYQTEGWYSGWIVCDVVEEIDDAE